MLFQALSICDYQLASYEFDKNGKRVYFRRNFRFLLEQLLMCMVLLD